MRLIDADVLIGCIKSTGLGTEDIVEAIEGCPTAYNVDEVVKQIEDVREKECVACTDTDCGYCKYSKECWNGEMGDKLALDKAIELAKGGGVE